MTPPNVPEAAVEAAIATSSTWPIRSTEEKGRYRERIESVLRAALPSLREQLLVEVREGLLSDDAINAADRAGWSASAASAGDQGESGTLDVTRAVISAAIDSLSTSTAEQEGR